MATIKHTQVKMKERRTRTNSSKKSVRSILVKKLNVSSGCTLLGMFRFFACSSASVVNSTIDSR